LRIIGPKSHTHLLNKLDPLASLSSLPKAFLGVSFLSSRTDFVFDLGVVGVEGVLTFFFLLDGDSGAEGDEDRRLGDETLTFDREGEEGGVTVLVLDMA